MKRSGAIYCRISEEDSTVPKVEIQETVLRALAESESIELQLEHVYVDNGIPATGASIRQGTRDKRPAFDRMLQAAEAGEFDVILAVSGDRLARNYPDGMDVVEACHAGGVVLLFEDDGALDPRTPAGEEQAMSLFVGGRREIRSRSLKQRRRFDAETAKGNPLWGGRPFGFAAQDPAPINKHGMPTQLWTQHHPTEAAEVQWAFSTIAGGGSIYTIVRSWNDRGVLTTSAGRVRRERAKPGTRVVDGKWSYAAVQGLLRNPRYAGIVVRRGEPVEGVEAAWEPIVDREVFDTVQAILSDPKRRTSTGTKPVHLLAGVVRCSCGSVMRSGTGNGEPIYRCAEKRDGRSPGERHASIATRLVDPLVRREVVTALVVGPSSILPADGVDLVPLDNELSKVRSSRSAIVDLIAQGLLTEADATKQLTALKVQEDDLTAKRDELARSSARASMLAGIKKEIFAGGRASLDAAAKASAALEERFDALPLAQRRELVRSLLQVTVAPGGGTGRVSIEHAAVTSLSE